MIKMWAILAALLLCAHPGFAASGPGDCSDPPSIQNLGSISCSDSSCSVTCESGYQFSNNKTVGSLTCGSGGWVWESFHSSVNQSCNPICDPPCQNGGECCTPGVCKCSYGWTGDQCQTKDKDTCSIAATYDLQKIAKNASPDCSAISQTCKLTCSDGYNFHGNKTVMDFVCQNSAWISVDQTQNSDLACHKMCVVKGQKYYSGWKQTTEINSTCSQICSCEGGEWNCADVCKSTCTCYGDPHCLTFDGSYYTYVGDCSYHMLQVSDYFQLDVISQNTPCVYNGQHFTCVETVTVNVKYENQPVSILLTNSSGAGIEVNGVDETANFPFSLLSGLIHARKVGEQIVSLTFADGLEIKWNPKNFLANQVIINAPASYIGKTKGLCGTLDGVSSNDFTTPDRGLETTAAAFTNAWRVKEKCDSSIVDPPNPCESNPERKQEAEESCALMRSIFADCNVNKEAFVKSCVYDLCAANTNAMFNSWMLSAYSALGDACCLAETPVNWRDKVPGSSTKCPDGQVYQECSKLEYRSCADYLSPNAQNYSTPVVSGCRCPKGQALDDNNQCVAIEKCKPKQCTFNNSKFESGSSHFRSCSCNSGQWTCTANTTAACANENKGPKYTIEKTNKNWHQAYAACSSKGMYLAEISSKQERDTVHEMITKAGLKNVNIWIGATRLGDTGFYWFRSGNKLGPYTDWGKNQPSCLSCDGDRCVQMWTDVDQQWDDTDCTLEKYYVCERD